MIEFKALTLRNFFSVGDHPLVIPLDGPSPTLVSGHNGAGKSVCVVDSLCWGLFNKPYRKVNKAEIVNKLNGKNCSVVIDFNVGGSSYKVTRGIKPNVFTIEKDGKLLDEDSNANDQQKMLEENILRLNFDSFKQVVILSSSSFVPFMDLTAAQRRVIVEDILDIEIFTKMNMLLKEKQKITKAEIHTSDLDISHLISQINTNKSTITTLKSDKQADIADREGKIAGLVSSNRELLEGIASKAAAAKQGREILDYKKTNTQGIISSATSEHRTAQGEIIRLTSSLERTRKWLECSECEQPISEERRNKIIENLEASLKEAQIKFDQSQKTIHDHTRYLKQLQPIEDAIVKDEEEVRQVHEKVRMNKNLIAAYGDDIFRYQKSMEENSGLKDIETKITELEKQHQEAYDKFMGLSEKGKYHEVMLSILKDDGIKAQAIKQYLPVINDRANDYLKTLNFFVGFDLDENFNESIRVRHRDPQTYSSLSQGEKQRIDLALLFTWREVAQIKNSVNTNILILDETFDSSLDNEGIDNLQAILDRLSGKTNIFVISHKGEFLEDRIEDQMIFEKVKNFTTMRRAA